MADDNRSVDVKHEDDTSSRRPVRVTRGYYDRNETDKFKSPLKDEHRINQEELFIRLESNPKYGLSEQEASKRLEEIGHNALNVPTFSMTGMNITLFIFWIAAFVLAVLYFENFGQMYLIIALSCTAVAIIVTISTFNLSKKNKAAEDKLSEYAGLLAHEVKVLRNGVEQYVRPADIVPGDIIYLYYGVKPSADIRVLECFNLRVNYNYLTGDILDLDRTSSRCNDLDPIMADNIILCGSDCVGGQGKGIVLRTGGYTVIGRTILDD